MTTSETIYLRTFRRDELIFDGDETRTILEFFFRFEQGMIREAEMTDALREFAQALLVAAVDASNRIGWMKAIWRATAVPGASMKSVFAKLAKKGGVQWFKSLKRSSGPFNAKIYEFVRNELSRRFRTDLSVMSLARSGGNRGSPFHRVVCINLPDGLDGKGLA